jgi:pseudaminic acid cytidylyltransferase
MICVSFHWSKTLGEFRQGGAILHDNEEADAWLRRARFDGRTEGVAPKDDTSTLLGVALLHGPADVAARLLWLRAAAEAQRAAAERRVPGPITAQGFPMNRGHRAEGGDVNLAIIPARGGSQRIPRKNIRRFHGKPIVAYSIEAARKSGVIDVVAVSTEDPEIAGIAVECGATVLHRPATLARDEVGTQEVTREALREFGNVEYACCVYATCPMLVGPDLRIAFYAMRAIQRWVYVPGWYYWGHSDWFRNGFPLETGVAVEMEPHRYIDINSPEDWSAAERMYSDLNREAA